MRIFGRDTLVSPELTALAILVSTTGWCNEGDEDQEAGFTGAPFVQPAHDEEWMEYIDWGEVEAQAGGSSSSSSGA